MIYLLILGAKLYISLSLWFGASRHWPYPSQGIPIKMASTTLPGFSFNKQSLPPHGQIQVSTKLFKSIITSTPLSRGWYARIYHSSSSCPICNHIMLGCAFTNISMFFTFINVSNNNRSLSLLFQVIFGPMFSGKTYVLPIQ